MIKILHLIGISLLLFSSVMGIGQTAETSARKFLSEQGFSVERDDWRITSEHTSEVSNVKHIRFQQLVDGFLVYGTESSLHISKTGTVLSSRLQFMERKSMKFSNSDDVISPLQAVEAVAWNMDYQITDPIGFLKSKRERRNEMWMSNGGISMGDIRAELVYVQKDENSLNLIWEIEIRDLDDEHWWIFQVNAEDGSVLGKVDIAQSCYPMSDEAPLTDHNKNLFRIENKEVLKTPAGLSCNNCYEVFALPLATPYSGERTIMVNPADVIASPFGWHDLNGEVGAENTVTSGNNANAFEANDNFGYQPDGEFALNFTDYPFDPEYSGDFQYEDASITNVFYWANVLHDVTYRYGFTEAAGNFQHNNYLNGGAPHDPVIIECQSTFRPCNASFSTQGDGIAPVLKLNLCNDKDGGFDGTVIAHEWGHGLSDRLTDGWYRCLRNKETPSEGWSDWLAVVLTIKPEDTGATPRAIANYLKNQGPEGTGVRQFRYSTDMNVNPQTYESVITTTGVHHIGAIWGEILWEVTWSLIDEFGFDPDIHNFTGDINRDAGNIMAMAIIIESLKFTHCRPGFVDARDAIILAAWQIYGREVLCGLWEAFAKRGLGYYADQGSSESTTDGVASFDGPGTVTTGFIGPESEFCLNSGVYEFLDGGFPLGGIYSGAGVIDNGDGLTFNFDPAAAGIGVHSVNYYLPETACSEASEASADFVVEADVTPPEIECIQDFTVNQSFGVAYPVQFFTDNILVSDYCPGEVEIVQSPEPGTLLLEVTNEITITAIDLAGNQASCSFFIYIQFGANPQYIGGVLSLSPNPSRNQVQIFNPFEKRIENMEIWDPLGRRVLYQDINNSELVNWFSVEELSSGTYFIRIKRENETDIISLLKL